MGVSSSSLLDEAKSNYIKGQAEAELTEFRPYYTKQFSVARFAQAEDDLEQNKQKVTQLLKQKVSSEDAAVLYEGCVLYFDETRKWRDRYVVVRANYCLECHDSLDSFVKGVPPRQKLLPTGGAVLTAEDAYMAMVDKCFPGDGTVKEDFVPPLSGMPGQFPVYLRLPYRRDSYFCFRQEVQQKGFLSILSDCIRHQNQDFLKKKTCEVQAFLKAIQLYREDKGKFHAWEMLIGSDVRVMANLVMEKLLPSLEKDMLPRLKAKKTEKKRVWFATVEAAYILVQEHLLSGLTELKEECRTSVRQQEVVIHSDMDQILEARKELEDKIRAEVSGPAEKLCSEAVQPYLGSVLEELMEPISSGFQEGRKLSEDNMDEACHGVLQGGGAEELKKILSIMAKPDLQSCYRRIGSLQEKLQQLQERFGFCNVTGMIQSAQIDLQQLMENAAFTFEQMFQKAVQDHPDDSDNAASAIEKAKYRILKQYDYDSSSVRKRIFQDALVSITLPFIKKNLASTCKAELQGLQQADSDHSAFIHVDNLYEEVLLQILDKEVTKVVKEAATLKKYNLVADSRDLLSQSSRSSLSSPAASTPGSPSTVPASPATASSTVPASPANAPTVPASPANTPTVPASPTNAPTVPASPLTVNGLSAESEQTSTEPTEVQIPLKGQEEVDAVIQEVNAPEADVIQIIKAEPETSCSSLVPPQSLSAPQIVIHHQAVSEQKDEPEPEAKKNEAEVILSETAVAIETVRTNQEREQVQVESPGPDPGFETPKEVETPSVEGPDSGNQSEGGAAGSEPETSPDPPKEADKPSIDDPDASSCPDPPKEADSLDPEFKPSSDPSLEAVAPSLECPDPEPSPVPDFPKDNLPVESPDPQPVLLSADSSGSDPAEVEENPASEVQEVSVVAPPGGEEAAADVQSEGDKEEPVTVSDPNSLDVSVGSDSPASDLDSTDEVSTTSDVLDDGATLSRSPESSDGEDKPQREEQTSMASPLESPAAVRAEVEAGASVEAEGSGATSPPTKTIKEERTPEEDRPLDCVKEIRDLVAEVIDVEELAQHYPDGIPKEE